MGLFEHDLVDRKEVARRERERVLAECRALVNDGKDIPPELGGLLLAMVDPRIPRYRYDQKEFVASIRQDVLVPVEKSGESTVRIETDILKWLLDLAANAPYEGLEGGRPSRHSDDFQKLVAEHTRQRIAALRAMWRQQTKRPPREFIDYLIEQGIKYSKVRNKDVKVLTIRRRAADELGLSLVTFQEIKRPGE